MTGLVRRVGDAAYWMGLIAVVAGIVLRIAPSLGAGMNISSRGGLIFAACLFLCSLSSREMSKAG